MIHVLCSRPSAGSMVLVGAIQAAGGQARRAKARLPVAPGDRVVCWGQSLARFDPVDGVTYLNAIPLRNKLQELRALREAGIAVPEFIQHAPAAGEGLAVGAWLPRRLHHQDSEDFINPPTEPGFWTRRLAIEEEWRFHIFRGRSIRAAAKIPIPQGHVATFHYSYRMGPVSHRRLSIRAVRALGLDFGAVDVVTVEGQPVVLEVNRRPGLDPNGHTAERYAQAILEA